MNEIPLCGSPAKCNYTERLERTLMYVNTAPYWEREGRIGEFNYICMLAGNLAGINGIEGEGEESGGRESEKGKGDELGMWE